MAEHVRVAVFDADEAALENLVAEIGSSEGPPEGLPATGIIVLADRAAGRVVVATRFASEDDLRAGSAVLEAMSPPSGGSMQRVRVDSYEVVLERNMSS
jgi:hypothetical protein